ncbi:MAG: helix-turn-helix transcriptional regulator [Clostridia bacterium]|nr:helix-turn-helix transcriptional regulator [Clostridia bacterium]
MNQSQRKAQMNDRLRQALKEYHALPGVTQEKLAEKLGISTKACSSLENGKNGFSALTAFALFSLLPMTKKLSLLTQLCAIACRTPQKST